MIFDNADDIEMWIKKDGDGNGSPALKQYLPRSSQGRTIFTTRSRKVAVKLAQENMIEISEMDERTASLLMSKSLFIQDLSTSQQDSLDLLQQLTFLPLAIVQAAAYMNENSITFSHYLFLLKGQEQDVIDLLSEDFEDEGQYQKKNPIATTWLVSFEHIRRLCPLAAEYLSFMCCINPRDIPEPLLPSAQSFKKRTDAIGTLSAYSFVSRRSTDNSLDLHRLVHLATRNWLRKEETLAKWTLKVVTRLGEVFPKDNHELKKRSLWRTYLPHAQYVLDSSLIEDDAEGKVKLLYKFGICLFHGGRYNEAEKRLLPVAEVNTKLLGKEHPYTLDSISNLAFTYTMLGWCEKAEKLDTQVIEIRDRILGKEHPDTLQSMHNLASTYIHQGRWKEAEELGVQVVKTSEKILGKEDPITLGSMSNLATTYKGQGRWEEAEELETQVLEKEKKVLGKKHPDTLRRIDNLARTYKVHGRCKEAEELGIQILERVRRVLGEEHPDTLNSMGNLATTYRKQGRWEEAEELGIQVTEIRERVLGRKHPSTLVGMANLAVTYKAQGRWKEGEELEAQALEMMKRVLGEDHPHTLQIMDNLASTWKSLGRDIEAWRLMEKCFEGRNQKLGADHSHTIASREKLLQWKVENSVVDS